jgi:molecular chaperone DnaK (HSP70)
MKSSTVPVSVTRRYMVGGTDWRAISLDVYAGERGLVRYCHKVATFTLSGIPAGEGGNILRSRDLHRSAMKVNSTRRHAWLGIQQC